MANTLEELTKNREKYQEALKINDGFESGLRNLLSNMYPDEAHFIYELLQNAEDKKAKNVVFKLFSNCLIFEHDGGKFDKSQLFTIDDIDAISNIGKSTKKNDNTSIGKFGVGFKAVFAYTNSPKIYSGDYAFEINDLVVPKAIEPIDIEYGITRFVLPFDNRQKLVKDAISQIHYGLKNINKNTLLFLTNIENIKCFCDNKEYEYSRVKSSNSDYITLIDSNSKSEVDWLRYSKKIKIEDEEDNKIKECVISVAFKTEKDELTKIHKIIPTNDGVSIFFHAEKEISNLKFVINAPFASTISRDSVRKCRSNEKIIAEMSIFMKDILKDIKAKGLMNIDFLKVLPNNESNIPDMYIPIWKTIIEQYKICDYFPTRDGDLSNINNVVRSSQSIENIISVSDLKLLMNNEKANYLKNPQQLNQAVDNFYKQFNIKELSITDLIFNYPSIIEEIAAKKDNKWFYLLFNELIQINWTRIPIYQLKRCKIFKLRDGYVSNAVDKKLFIFTQDNQNAENLSFVSKDLYSHYKNDKIVENNEIKELLNDCGIIEYNLEARVKEKLERYSKDLIINNEELLSDMKMFLLYYAGKKIVIYFIINLLLKTIVIIFHEQTNWY